MQVRLPVTKGNFLGTQATYYYMYMASVNHFCAIHVNMTEVLMIGSCFFYSSWISWSNLDERAQSIVRKSPSN